MGRNGCGTVHWGYNASEFAGFFKTAALKVIMQDPDLDELEARKLTDDARDDLMGNCVRNRYYLTV